jgi:hypothetical protein
MGLALLLAAVPALTGTAMLPWKGGANDDTRIRDLAAEAILAYTEPDRATYLDNLAALQLVARRYDDAARSLGELVVLRKAGTQPLDAAGAIRWQVYARARQLETATHLPFGEAYARAFREVFATLDDVLASQVIASFGSDVEPYGPQPAQLRADYLELLAQRKGSDVAVADAVALVKAYQAAEAYAAFRPFTGKLIDEDDRRRYDVREPMLVSTPDGASVTVLVMLPRHRAPCSASPSTPIHGGPRPNCASPRRMVMPPWSAIRVARGCRQDWPRHTNTMAWTRTPRSSGSRSSPGATAVSACMEEATTASPNGPPRNTGRRRYVR